MADEVVRLLPNNALCVDAEQLASRLRDVADAIQSGEFPALERVVVLLQSPEGVQRRCYGRPTSLMELLGLIEFARHGVLHPPQEQ